LNTARSKGGDAAIQSDLASIQTEAEIYYGGTGANSYGNAAVNTCAAVGTATTLAGGFSTDTSIEKAVAGADTANGSGAVTCDVNAAGTQYAVEATLVTNNATSWCVDSTGVAKVEPNAAAVVLACP
jgi:hypothetical protein